VWTKVFRKDVATHNLTCVVNQIVPCLFSEFGCSVKVKGGDLNKHIASSNREHLIGCVEHSERMNFVQKKKCKADLDDALRFLPRDIKKSSLEGLSELADWRRSLVPRYLVEIQDSKTGKWYEGSVVAANADGRIKIHYNLW
jgi:hypothetical protein